VAPFFGCVASGFYRSFPKPVVFLTIYDGACGRRRWVWSIGVSCFCYRPPPLSLGTAFANHNFPVFGYRIPWLVLQPLRGGDRFLPHFFTEAGPFLPYVLGSPGGWPIYPFRSESCIWRWWFLLGKVVGWFFSYRLRMELLARCLVFQRQPPDPFDWPHSAREGQLAELIWPCGDTFLAAFLPGSIPSFSRTV